MQVFVPFSVSLDYDHFMNVHLRGIYVKGDPGGFYD